jgi:hypothetical protein
MLERTNMTDGAHGEAVNATEFAKDDRELRNGFEPVWIMSLP